MITDEDITAFEDAFVRNDVNIVVYRERPHELLIPQDISEEDRQLLQNTSVSKAWVHQLNQSEAERKGWVLHDSDQQWQTVLRYIKEATWSTEQTPSKGEENIKSTAWWVESVRSLYGSKLLQYYTSIISSRARNTENWDRPGELPSLTACRYIDALWGSDLFSMFARKWFQSAFCRIEPSRPLIESLLLTVCDDPVFSPWKAFSIIINPEIIPPICRLWCVEQDEGQGVCVVSAVDTEGQGRATDPNVKGAASWATEARHQMLLHMVRGLCLTIQNAPAALRQKGGSKNKGRNVLRPPPFATFELAPALKIDFRSEVQRAWEDGRPGGIPRKQFVVRGHWRNQACGTRLSERKRIWIQPFWKGPEASRVLLRRVEVP